MEERQKQFLDSTQKFVLCGRAMLDAVEELVCLMMKDTPEEKAETETEATQIKTATLEEVRVLLAEKARSGYRAEVKALLTAHGANQLSDISDPVELGRLMEEASLIA